MGIASAVKEGLSETFSLKNMFKIAAIGIPAFLLGGLVDLAVWHYLPGGVELFMTLKPMILDNPVMQGLSSAFSSIASMLGGVEIADTARTLTGGLILDN